MSPTSKHPFKAAAAVVSSLVLAFGLSACGSPDDISDGSSTPGGSASAVGARTPEQIQESGTIKLGVFSDKSPFGYVDSQGEYTGYDVYYGERIAEDLGVEAEWVPVEAASRVEFLESGKVDVILANFTVTPERAEKVDFANPYMKVSLGAVSPADKPVTQDQLGDSKILVVKGTTADTWVQANLPDADVQEYEQYSQLTNALADRRGDVWITDNTEALAYTAQNSDFVTSITSFGSQDTIAPAVQKGNTELLTWLNEQQVKLAEESFFHKDFEQTLAPVYGDVISPDELVVEGGKLD